MENSHASTSLSYADGLAKAYTLRGETDRAVVAVIGDGALTGGMAWEALNNIAVSDDSRLVIVVNDNGRSYQPTIGGLANHLSTVRITQRYENVLDYIKTTLSRTPVVGPPVYGTLHGIKKGLKDVLQPQVLFEDLGLKYLGPIDGHDEAMVEQALRRAKEYGGPVLVHVITRKGFGYAPAEENEDDRLHQVPGAPRPGTVPARGHEATWSQVFGEELAAIGAQRPDVVAITAAMLNPTGLDPFARAFPDRVYDVGIAEQHAVTSAAGLAMGGLHPVVAIYATFLNRAFDQVLMDVALHQLPVTLVLDRAGVTGPDGASHNGMWDGSILQVVPGLKIAAPRDAARVAELLERGDRGGRRADRGALPQGHGGPRGRGGGQARRHGRAPPARSRAARRRVARDVLLLGPADGHDVPDRGRADGRPRHRRDRGRPALDQAGRRGHHRRGPAVPAGGRGRGQRPGRGFGDAVARLLHDHDVDTPVKTFGLPQRFLTHGDRSDVLEEVGLTPQHLARQLTEAVARRTPADVPEQNPPVGQPNPPVRQPNRQVRQPTEGQ